jgi:hypothetical protein
MCFNRIVILCGIMLLAVALTVSADVIDPNYHPVTRCVVIDNGNEFPDIAIVGAYMGTGVVKTIERYIVNADSCLTKGYKFNSFYLFWVGKAYLESQGLANLPLADFLPSISAKRLATTGTALPMGLIPVQIEPFGGTVPDTNPVVKERLVYRLTAGGDDETVSLFLAQKTTYDKDGNEKQEVYTTAISMGRERTIGVETANLHVKLSHGCLVVTPGFTGSATAELINCQGRAVSRFSRECHAGATYVVPSAGLSAGIYWLRMNAGGATMNVKLSTFE